MKKYIAPVLALIVIMSAGCGKNEEAMAPSPSAGNDAPTIVVGEAQKTEETDSESGPEASTGDNENAASWSDAVADTQDCDAQEEADKASEGLIEGAHLFDGDFGGVAAEGIKNGIGFNQEKKSREMKDEAGDVYFKAEYQIPSVEIKDNPPAQAAINEYLSDGVVTLETDMELMAAEAASFIEVVKDDENYDPENDGAFSAAYDMVSEITAARLDGAAISLRETSYSFTGGAHGNHAYTGYNFDTKTGKLLTLSGIAEDTDAFKASAEKYIKSACFSMENKEELFPEYEESIPDIFSEGSWYLTDNGVVFIAQEYLLGPYSMGIMEFEVPYAMLDSMNPAYIR